MPDNTKVFQNYICPKCGHMEDVPLWESFNIETIRNVISGAITDAFLSGSQHGLEVGRLILNNEAPDKEKVVQMSFTKMQPIIEKYLGKKGVK